MNAASRRPLALVLAALSLGASLPAAAQVDVTISGDTATAEIDLPAPMGPTPYRATLTLSLDAPRNLSVANLGIDARVVDPLDPALLARLPAGAMAAVPAAFPVLVVIEPPAGAEPGFRTSFEDAEPPGVPGEGLSFGNTVAIELLTSNLTFVSPSPVRLYRAPLGGTFEDITTDVLAGSVRTRARTSEFSEFLLLEDQRPDAVAASAQYDEIALRLATPAVPAALRTALEAELAASRDAFNAQDYTLARTELADLVALVEAAAGITLANRWRSTRDLDNIGGDLVAESANLDFYLVRLDND